MFINILKSIQKFSNSSRKYKDLEAVTSHCIEKLKLFVGFVLLSNGEAKDSNVELDGNLTLEDYLLRPIDSEIRNIMAFSEKKKFKELEFNYYDDYIHLIYPYILSPIYKACKRYKNSKLILISLDGIQKLVYCERFEFVVVDTSKLYGCDEFLPRSNSSNGIEFLAELLIELQLCVEDDLTKIHIIQTMLSILRINIDCFDCNTYYSIILTLFNIYSNAIDNGTRNLSNSTLNQIIELFFGISLRQKDEYVKKYFVLFIEVIYTLCITNKININIHNSDKEIGKVKLVMPFEVNIESDKFIDVECNLFKFASNTNLDQRVYKTRNLGLETLILFYTRYFDDKPSENNDFLSTYINRMKYIHMFCIIKNTTITDTSIRINSLKLWSISNHIDNFISFHGIYISKCIMGLFEFNLIELSEKISFIEILFDKLITNKLLFPLLFKEYDLNINNENLILRLFNSLTNILFEDSPNRSIVRDLHETVFKLKTRILMKIKSTLIEFKNLKLINNDGDIILMKKYLMNQYLSDFNNGNYTKSIDNLYDNGMIKEKDEINIANLLLTNHYISKISIGDYLSLPSKINNNVLKEYCNLFSFKGYSLDYSLYMFLSNFHLPGEAQKIDRIIEQFSTKYYNDNVDLFPNKDSVYIISFSLIILHTDAHHKEIKNGYRMTKTDFIKNNSKLLISFNYPIDFLETYYDNITLNEWIFEHSKDQTTLKFPFFEYFINFIDNIETENSINNEFKIKILSHELYSKILNLLIDNDSRNNNDLLNDIHMRIKKKYDLLNFSSEFTQNIVNWKIISNYSNQAMNDSLLKRKAVPFSENGQSNTVHIYYDGIKFNKISKITHNMNTSQQSNLINQNVSNTKWSNTIKINDSKNRDINGIFQACIASMITNMTNKNNVLIEDSNNYILLSKTLCSYYTEMISNLDFWVHINKEFVINWTSVIKLITEISILLNMEPCYTTNMAILSCLTNIVALPINYNDLFFHNSEIKNNLFDCYYDKKEKIDDNIIKKPYSSKFYDNFCNANNFIKDSKVILEALKVYLFNINNSNNKSENEYINDNKKYISIDQGVNLLTIINNDNYLNQLLLNDSNIFAIKCILEITNDYGDNYTYLFWFIVIGIISQIDRYYYIKNLPKSNDCDNLDYFDFNKTTSNQGKEIKEMIDFLNISKIKNILTKDQYSNSVNNQCTKTKRNIFSVTKNSVINSHSDDNLSNCKNNQVVKSYIYFKNSIYHNNLWCDEPVLENKSIIDNYNVLWIDNEIYCYLQNQLSLSNLRKIDKYNSEIITNHFLIYEKVDNLSLSNILKKNKNLIRNFFMGLLFNTINQISCSGKKIVELFLFNNVFEMVYLLIDSDYYDFYDIILWDEYFVPYFYNKTIRFLDSNSKKTILNLVNSFIVKSLNLSNRFIRNSMGETDYSKIVFISKESSLQDELLNNIMLYVNSENNNIIVNRKYSCFYLFKCILDNISKIYSIETFIPIIESLVNILSNIIIQYTNLKYYNTIDFNEILDIYKDIVSIIMSNIEFRKNSDCYNNKGFCEKTNIQSKKSFNILDSNKCIENIIKNEMDILLSITTSIISINHFALILDINLSKVIIRTLMNIIKISLGKNDKLVNDITYYLIYIFYLMIKNTYNGDIQQLIQEYNVENNHNNTSTSISNHFNSKIHNVFIYCLHEYVIFITQKYIIENNYINLYYYNLTNISRIICYWLKIAFKSSLVEDTIYIYNLIYELFNTISSNSNTSKDSDIYIKNNFFKNKINSDFIYECSKQNMNQEVLDEYEEEDDDDEFDDEEDDLENYLVDDETDINFIQYTSYNSMETDKSSFEVTNKKRQLYNSQLTLTNIGEIEDKNSNSKNSLTLLNKKIREINKILNMRENKDHSITDKILDSRFYLEVKNIDSDKKKKRPKMIMYNIYKMLDYYILHLNTSIIKSIFKDWLEINNNILLFNNMNMFNRDDIRMQFKLFVIYFRLLNDNRGLFGYDEWKLVVRYFSELLIKFTNNLLIDKKIHDNIIEDVDNINDNHSKNKSHNERKNGNIKRLSLDDLLVNYGEERINENNNYIDEYFYTRKRSNIESFFRSIFFQRKKYYTDSKRIKNYDDSDINIMKKKDVEKRLSNLKILLRRNWKCYSHKYIKNTCYTDMYNSYNKLLENIEEFVNLSIKKKIQENNYDNNIINEPHCVQDLYSVVLVMYKLLINWLFIDIGNKNINNSFREIYHEITKSLATIYSIVIKNFNFVKYDLYQYNLYIIQVIQIYTRMEFHKCFGRVDQLYKQDLLDYIMHVYSEYNDIEYNSKTLLCNFLVNTNNNRSSIFQKYCDKLNSSKHSNYYYFNSCYDLLLSNKVELKNIYTVLLYNLLNDIINADNENIDFYPIFMLNTRKFHKMVLDLTLKENKQLETISKEIIVKYYNENKIKEYEQINDKLDSIGIFNKDIEE